MSLRLPVSWSQKWTLGPAGPACFCWKQLLGERILLQIHLKKLSSFDQGKIKAKGASWAVWSFASRAALQSRGPGACPRHCSGGGACLGQRSLAPHGCTQGAVGPDMDSGAHAVTRVHQGQGAWPCKGPSPAHLRVVVETDDQIGMQATCFRCGWGPGGRVGLPGKPQPGKRRQDHVLPGVRVLQAEDTARAKT